jgi:hypothetical protein
MQKFKLFKAQLPCAIPKFNPMETTEKIMVLQVDNFIAGLHNSHAGAGSKTS